VLTETVNYLAGAIQEFGLAAFDVPALLGWAKADLGSTVAGTRTAAIAMVRARQGDGIGAAPRAPKPPPLGQSGCEPPPRLL
jgi:cytoskeleton-associated protein 5